MRQFLLAILLAVSFAPAYGDDGADSITIYQYDNGDDYFNEGLQRIVDSRGLIGFADEKGATVITPQYAFVSPFVDGLAKATIQGGPVTEGEYHRWVSPEWFYIDHCGNRLHADSIVRVSGNVRYSPDLSPLRSAFVTRTSDRHTVLTDGNGDFRIAACKGDSLQIDYVGTIRKTIMLTAYDTAISVSLDPYIPGPDELTEVSADSYTRLDSLLRRFVSGKDARIGIALIVDGRDTIEVDGRRDFPMLSVYKFPEAVAVADFCRRRGMQPSDTVDISAGELKPDTWSPMRDRYGIRDLRLPVGELLEWSVQQSDNNACDILFRLIGGPVVADSVMTAMGYGDEIVIASTEEEMHRDRSLCYLNRSTPIAMARLFDEYYRQERRLDSPADEAIAEMMISCATGTARLPAPLDGTGALIGHKTGTGDRNLQGRIIAVNDAGYIFLPDGRGYALAVFICDSAYDMPYTESLIGEISGLVYRSLMRID